MKTLLSFMVGMCLVLPAQAHPSHATRGEMEWRDGAFETAIQIRLADLEEALQFQKMDGVPFERAVRKIIEDAVELKDETGETIPMEWVGMEHEGFHVWVFLQWKAESGNRPHRLRNALFYTQEPRTVHVMEVKSPERRSSLSFRKGMEWRELHSPPTVLQDHDAREKDESSPSPGSKPTP